MPLYQICQVPVTTSLELQECQKISREIRTPYSKPYQSTCLVKRYHFQTVYTGNCRQRFPSIGLEKLKKIKNYISMGSRVGGLIGSFFGPKGKLIGSIIGGVVGFIAGFFTGCDDTYKVYKIPYTLKEECTLLEEGVRVTKHYYSNCFPVTQSVSAGYSEPQRCNFTTDSCAVTVNDPTCTMYNRKCQDHRERFLKANDSIPAQYTSVYIRVQKAQNDLKAAKAKMLNLKREENFLQNEYKESSTLLYHAKENLKLANESQSNLMSKIPVDLCLLNFYKQSSSVMQHISLRKLNIQTSLPLIQDLTIYALVNNIKPKSEMAISFLHHSQDEESSVTSGAKKIVQETLCARRRSRRSLSDVENQDVLSFTSWYIDDSKNVSDVQKACSTFRSSMGYLEKIISNLDQFVKNHSALQKNIETARMSANLHVSEPKKSDEVDVLQSEAVSSIIKQFELIEKKTTAEEIIKEWKMSSEVFTGHSNLSICFNLYDCIHVAFDSLQNLPTMLKISRQENLLILAHQKDMIISLLDEKNSIELLKVKVKNITNAFQKIRNVSLYCAPKPEVSLNNSDEHYIQLNQSVSFDCSVDSILPFRYRWIKDGRIIEEEEERHLTFIADMRSNGFYECMAISLSGNSTSNGTRIIVKYSPMFVEEPKSRVYWVPSSNATLPYFFCNGTAFPKPSIRWYHVAFNSSIPNEIKNALNASLFLPDKFNTSASGYYYCELNNSVGKSISKTVRLDIVKHYLADQKMEFSFNFTVQMRDIKSVSFNKTAQKMSNNESHSVNYTVFTNGTQGKVTFLLFSQPKGWENGTNPETFFSLNTKSRRNLANSVSEVLDDIIQKNFTINSDQETPLLVNNNAVQIHFYGNICRLGYGIKENGFLCGQCISGYYGNGKKCQKCGKGFYQPHPGTSFCIRCDDNKTTMRKGSTSLYSCVYPDLCKTGKHKCHKNATCMSDKGSYVCSCRDNFTGNGTFCEYIDLCKTGKHKCHKNATCMSDKGSYVCSCRDNFTGNGTFCEYIDFTDKREKSIKGKIKEENSNILFSVVIPVAVSVVALIVVIIAVIFCKKKRQTIKMSPRINFGNNGGLDIEEVSIGDLTFSCETKKEAVVKSQ